MKRIFPIIISLIMVSSILFTGCSSEKKLSIDGSLDATTELLTEAMAEKASFKKFTDTISEWAKENDIKVTVTSDNYMILSKDASAAASSSENFTFHTAVDFSSTERTENSIAAASAVMTALYSPDNHGAINGIFTLIENGDPVGAKAVNSEYLTSDNFIDIAYSGDSVICDSISISSDMEAHKSLDLTAPQYTEAYKITFKGKSGQSAYKNRGTYPNPVQTIGNLLASCQTSTILFELAEFNGGEATDMLPSQATATIVLHENDIESFTKKFDKSFENVEEAYEDAEDIDAVLEYTMEPVELPEIVISKEDTENIVTLMYTMINGNYLRDEETDELIAVSNIGMVSTNDNTFTLRINAKSLDSEVMDEIHTVVSTICGLSNIEYKEISTVPAWANNSGSQLAPALSEAMDIEISGALESKAATVFTEKNPDLNLIIWGDTTKDYDKGLKAIIEYMAIAGVKMPNVAQ